ncbi:Glutathione S-transferase, putative [Perkinsus marinus ATCC 50983]|uniref:Glutathione S-transferase, putative n=1 Tax=Perkinsus marinus (strain ATCC 50983 / TXsc) TaxID=423536 RepID=C5KKN2_PERM5|nr:Glutathione S-transferase, putative [Perkinsus marinus ATCC 50983]EER15144.1 Glutathione S-transferase, putative [Perkinsus marinus ATCC 50983]|eukprot:XP_002783348.1 Glutathione S-transferase, putative [Perkinsus marinus ATCC 50983]
MSSSLLKLHYFDIPARAEPIRLSFAIQGIPFEDDRITKEDWAKTLKPNHVFPLDQLPVLEFPDGKMATQSYAILRYVATLRPSYGLYPTDPIQRLGIDQLLDTFADIREKTRVVKVMSDGPAKEAAKSELANTTYPFYFERVERMIGDNKYSAGDHLTIADLMIDSILYFIFTLAKLGMQPSMLKPYEKLQRIQTLVAANPAVKLWREKREVKPLPAVAESFAH